MWPDDLDDDVDEMPTPLGGRDFLDQAEEALILIGAAAALTGGLIMPTLWLWQAVILR